MSDYKYKFDFSIPDAKTQREQVTQQGIGARPADEQKPMDKGFYESMYDAIVTYFDNAEEADRVLTAKEIDKDRVKGEVLREFDALDRLLVPEDQETSILDELQGQDVDSTEDATAAQTKRIQDSAITTFKAPESAGLMSKPDADGVQPTDGKDFETRLEERLVELEGFRAEPYKPDEDEEFLTVGYGHYGSDVKEGTVITETEARDLLRKDINKRMPQIKKVIKNFDSLSDDLKVEIAQSWFRGGISGSPQTIKLINEGKFTEAAAEFLENEEYRTTELGGVKTRMEALSNALKAEAD